jgi:2-hydroxychromene-2-carboxylate isomerase
MRQNWVLDQDINEPAQVLAALTGRADDPSRILEEAQSDTNKLKLREQTQLARDKGIFGAPTFFAGEEMFWEGNRLEDAMRSFEN